MSRERYNRARRTLDRHSVPSDDGLSTYALNILALIHGHGPIVDLEVNSGCRSKLVAEGFAVYVKRPSPYAVDKGGMRDHLEITDKGAAAIGMGRST